MMLCTSSRWNVPRGKIGAETVQLFADEMNKLCDSLDDPESKLGAERYILCRTVILQPVKKVNTGSEIADIVKRRVQEWREGNIKSMIEKSIETELELRKFYIAPPKKVNEIDEEFRKEKKFSKLVAEGRLHDAQRFATQDERVTIKDPRDTYKNNEGSIVLVSRTLKESNVKPHGMSRVLAQEFIEAANKNLIPPFQDNYIDEHTIEKTSKRFKGAAGLSGIHGNSFVHMLTVHGQASQNYRKSLARFAMLLSNKILDFGKIEALLGGRGLGLHYEELSKVRGLTIGEVDIRLVKKVINDISKQEPMIKSGSIQLCLGAKGGIDALVHATDELMSIDTKQARKDKNEDVKEKNNDLSDRHDENVKLRQELLENENNQVNNQATIFLDAKNAFPNLERGNALARVRFDWPKAARAIYNCYRGSPPVLYRSKETQHSFWTWSEEGTQQGCPWGMGIYGVGTRPLIEKLKNIGKEENDMFQNMNIHSQKEEEENSQGEQNKDVEREIEKERDLLKEIIKMKIDNQKPTPAAFADDIRFSGTINQCIEAFKIINTYGPAYGVFPSQAKTKMVVREEDINRAKEYVIESKFPEIKVVTKARNLGSILGPQIAKEEYAREEAKELARQVEVIAHIAPRDPHAIHAVFTSCIKSKWVYLQRVIPTEDPQEIYGPIEEAITRYLIPAVTGWTSFTTKEREMLALPVREGGMAIEDPTKSASSNYKDSSSATLKLQRYIVEGREMKKDDFIEHNKFMGKTTSISKINKRKKQEEKAKEIESSTNGGIERSTQIAMQRAREYKTGAWLTVKPQTDDLMHLNKYEWLDMVSLRYNKPLIKAPKYCTFHPKIPYTLHHAATCKGGGNLYKRHRIIQNCLQAISRKALGSSAIYVEREPWIVPQGTCDKSGKAIEGLRADLRLSGLESMKENTFIDVRVFYPTYPPNSNTQSRTGQDGGPKRHLEKQMNDNEEEKIEKYFHQCEIQGWGFYPFVVSTDGVLAPKAEKVLHLLAEKLSKGWATAKGVCLSWMKARIAMAVARASSACLRGCRIQPRSANHELDDDFEDRAGIPKLLDREMGWRSGDK